jgi:hypothetical protein
MGAITISIADAFFGRQPKKIRNTSIIIQKEVTYLYIFDTIAIAQLVKGEKFISITDGGWQSNVAKEALDSILLKTNFRIQIKKGIWHLYNRETQALTKMYLNSWYTIPLF